MKSVRVDIHVVHHGHVILNTSFSVFKEQLFDLAHLPVLGESVVQAHTHVIPPVPAAGDAPQRADGHRGNEERPTRLITRPAAVPRQIGWVGDTKLIDRACE